MKRTFEGVFVPKTLFNLAYDDVCLLIDFDKEDTE